MPKSSSYQTVADGDTFTHPLKETLRLACCDCGLAHDIEFKVSGNKLIITISRNERATSALRRAQKY